MLYHVTMTHLAQDCPGYDPAQQGPFIDGAEKMDAVAAQLNVKVHNLLWGAPNHIAFAVLEADSLAAIGRYVFSMPLRQEFAVIPVQNLNDVVAMARAMQAASAK